MKGLGLGYGFTFEAHDLGYTGPLRWPFAGVLSFRSPVRVLGLGLRFSRFGFRVSRDHF